jgi:hypothetical protein
MALRRPTDKCHLTKCHTFSAQLYNQANSFSTHHRHQRNQHAHKRSEPCQAKIKLCNSLHTGLCLTLWMAP